MKYLMERSAQVAMIFYFAIVITGLSGAGCSSTDNLGQQLQQRLSGGGRVTGYDPLGDEFGPEFQ